jgi:filamentous hemagglutinin
VSGDTVVADTAGVRITQQGLDTVSNHLSQFGAWDENTAMLQRLQSSFSKGESVTGADANFYQHELTESNLMQGGMSQADAHAAALEQHGVTSFDLYHPDVIQAFPESFNNSWRAYWGIPPKP